MTLDDGVLVSRRWLERVNQSLFGHSQIAHEYNDSTSLFYDVRPAILASAWTQNASGVYQATAKFIVNDAVDSSFTFPVVAPTATDKPDGDVGTTRFFVIWRGRWEMIASAGNREMTGEEILGKLRVSAGNTVTSVTPSRGSVSSATGSASGSYTPVGNIALALAETTSQASGVEIVVDIQAVDGVLGVETKKLTATFTGDPATITSTVATQSVNVVTDVTSSSANRVSSVTAR